MTTQKEVLLETLTHIFFMDGTKVSKIEYSKPAPKFNDALKAITPIDISGTDGSCYEVDRLIRSLGITGVVSF